MSGDHGVAGVLISVVSWAVSSPRLVHRRREGAGVEGQDTYLVVY